MRTNFQDSYDPDKKYLMSGDLLNQQARALNALSGEVPPDFTQNQHVGHLHGANTPPPMQVGVAVITDASEGCSKGVYGDKYIVDPPCRSEDRYLAQFRYFSWSNDRWEPYDMSLHLDASGFWEPTDTKTSQRPATGYGYGSIPQFRVGDVVTAYWDGQRGVLVPIHSPYQDVPAAQFESHTAEEIASKTGESISVIEVYVEVRQTSETAWEPMARLAFRVPADMEDSWRASTSTSFYVKATHETAVRLRGVNTSDFSASCHNKRLQMTGAGRNGDGNSYRMLEPEFDSISDAIGGGSVLSVNWQDFATVEGRYKDSPLFERIDTSAGSFRVKYEDDQDTWIVHVEADITVEVTVTEPSDEEAYCPCEYVCDVICEEDGTVSEVCYATIYIPKIPGMDCDEHCGECICVPCGSHPNLNLSSSYYQSSSTSSATSTSYSSQSKSSSSASSQTAESWSSLSYSSQSIESWSTQSYSSTSDSSSSSFSRSFSSSSCSTQSQLSWSSLSYSSDSSSSESSSSDSSSSLSYSSLSSSSSSSQSQLDNPCAGCDDGMAAEEIDVTFTGLGNTIDCSPLCTMMNDTFTLPINFQGTRACYWFINDVVGENYQIGVLISSGFAGPKPYGIIVKLSIADQEGTLCNCSADFIWEHVQDEPFDCMNTISLSNPEVDSGEEWAEGECVPCTANGATVTVAPASA